MAILSALLLLLVVVVVIVVVVSSLMHQLTQPVSTSKHMSLRYI